MEFRVLGPLEVRVHDRPLPLGGTRPRAVLAALLLGRNGVVPVNRLIAAIWGDDPPGTPTAQIQAAVSALRKTLGADRIVTRSPGYLLRTERGELDLDEFDREVAAARRMREEGDLDGAADALRAALQWWRDDALVDLAELPVRAGAVAVDERRWVAWEERVEVDLALRRHADLVSELSTLVTKQPLRDRLWAQLIRAQYRCGRRAEALETYQRARQVMLDELGLEPAPELAALHEAILADDRALGPDVLPLGPQPEWTRPPCPYRALEAYRPDDTEIFHGRSLEIATVLERARTGPVTVVGPSGSGKSSLVLAGVLSGLAGFSALVIRPSDRGRVDLAVAAAMAQTLPATDRPHDVPALATRIVDGGLGDVVADVLAHTGGERLIVVLDQAEELLTQDRALVDRVVGALFEPAFADRLTVIATLRADFLGAVLERPALSATLGGRAVFTLGAMGPDQLRDAVTAPIAELPGVAFQAGLVERILGDVGSEAGALALLGLTLTLLWNEQVDGMLTHQSYDDLGRVPGALAAHAEGEWRRRNLADEEPVLRRLMGHLVQVDPEGRMTRRVASRGELDEQTWRMAARLSPTRLLVVTGAADGEQTVQLAHEALLSHWPRLSGWIEGDADFHAWRTALRGDLERWRRADRDPALLVRGAVLADARRWSADHGAELGDDEVEFVGLSQRHERSAGRRSRILRSGLAAAAVLVLILGGVFVQLRTRANAEAVVAESRALAAHSVTAASGEPKYAALAAVAAYDRAPTSEARDALLNRYLDVAGLGALYTEHDVIDGAARTSSDGRVTVAAHTHDAEFTIWIRRADRTDRLRRPRVDGSTVEVAADGTAVWLLDRDGIARLDVATGDTRTVVRTGWGGAPKLSLSPDGTRILLRDTLEADTTYRVREWATDGGRELGSATFPRPDPSRPAAVQAGRSPRTVLIEYLSSGDYRAEQLDLGTGERTVLARGASGATASDASSVVTCAVEGDRAVLTGIRVADRAPIGRATLPGEASSCPVFVAGPDGRVAVRQGFGEVRLVDLRTGDAAMVTAFSPGSRLVDAVPAMLTPDGSRLVVTGPSWVGLADLTDPATATPLLQHARVLDDGRGLVGVSEDGSRLVVSPLVRGGPAATAAARPSAYVDPGSVALRAGYSDVVADRIAADEIALRHLPGLEPLATVTLPVGHLDGMFFDVADRLVTVVDGQVLWWDPDTGTLQHRLDLAAADRPVPAPGSPEPAFTVVPTPDPNRIAVSYRDRPHVVLRDIDDGRVVDTLPVGGDVDRVMFQRTSDYVLVDRPTSTEIWDGRTKQRVLGPLPLGDAAARVAAMTRRPGRFMTVDLVAGELHVGVRQVGSPDPVTSMDVGPGVPTSFTADGDVVSVESTDGILSRVVRLDPVGWRDEVCAMLVGAGLTADDRAAHPDVPEGPFCPGTTL